MRTMYFLENKGFTDFSPCDAGKEKCEPCHKFGPNIRNYYLIHFVVSGEGKINQLPVKKGIVLPGYSTTSFFAS